MLPCQVNNTMSSSAQNCEINGTQKWCVCDRRNLCMMGVPNVIAVKPGFQKATTAIKPKSIRSIQSMLLRGAPRPWIILGSLTQHPGVFSLPLVLLVNIDLTLIGIAQMLCNFCCEHCLQPWNSDTRASSAFWVYRWSEAGWNVVRSRFWLNVTHRHFAMKQNRVVSGPHCPLERCSTQAGHSEVPWYGAMKATE